MWYLTRLALSLPGNAKTWLIGILVALGILLVVEIVIFAMLIKQKRDLANEEDELVPALDAGIGGGFSLGDLGGGGFGSDEFAPLAADESVTAEQQEVIVPPTEEELAAALEEPVEQPQEEAQPEEPAEEPAQEAADESEEDAEDKDRDGLMFIPLVADAEEAEPIVPAEPTEEPIEALADEDPDGKLRIMPIILPLGVDEGETIRFNKSFEAKLIQSDDMLKARYTELKNYLLSYNKVHARNSWKRESFRFGRQCVARLGVRGKTLCLYLATDAAFYEDTKYKVEDVSDVVANVDTPCMYRIKNDRRMGYAKQLIDHVMATFGSEQKLRVPMDYYVPYEDTETLIERGLIKRTITKGKKETFF